MNKNDFVFLVSTSHNNQQIGMAFCSSNGMDKELARQEVNRVLKKRLSKKHEVHYLGKLDYRDMDASISNHSLSTFEKYPPVWLWIKEE
ncbi:hypothetical protein BTR23_25000 [Alkalihalophilus pseudofirmus]|nr:hypothetical protein BTR23_25000 [Alkalihalophilus pseudofirmus]